MQNYKKMEQLFENPTDSSPLIDFSADGNLKMEGILIPEDADKVFAPWIQYISDLDTPRVIFEINLSYFNTASSKKIMELLRHLDANSSVSDIQINWHYEEGDEDSVEVAEIYEEALLRANFRYFEYAE